MGPRNKCRDDRNCGLAYVLTNSAEPQNCFASGDYYLMSANNRIVLSSDHVAIQLRQAIADLALFFAALVRAL